MGILPGSACLLLEEAKRRPLSGRIIQLGRTYVFFREDELRRWAHRAGVQLAKGVDVQLSQDPVLAAHGCMEDRSLFGLLGFDEVLSLDHTAWEGADVICDLNHPVAAEHRGKFDFVFDGGTLQSVFHVPQVLANIHDLLRIDGRVCHALAPSTNHVDLGFYMFSPTFFSDYYSTNSWQIDNISLCLYTAYWVAGRLKTGPFDVYHYEPGCLDHLSYGRFGRLQAGIFVTCGKTAETTVDQIPQQGYYQRLWSGEETKPSLDLERRTRQFATRRRLGGLWSAYKLVMEHLRRIGPKSLPPRVARY